MSLSRRSFVGGALAAATLPRATIAAGDGPMPSLFFAHGAPFLATDAVRGAQLAELAAALPRRPRGIVAFTPHVRAERVTAAATGVARRSFPRRFRERVAGIEYAPPDGSALLGDVTAALSSSRHPLTDRAHPGFNHTVWMGLMHMFPAADLPVVEVALPFEDTRALFELGQHLAPLRNEDVLVVSSGSLTHNLATIGIDPTPSWAIEFDHWVGERLGSRNIDAMLDWRTRAPAANVNHPDDGAHFNVLMLALGAAAAGGRLGATRSMHEGWEFGSFTTREYLFL